MTKEDRFSQIMQHYIRGTQDMTTRMTRKNGWNEVINAYMGKLPINWPYNALVTDPRIRSTVLEKTARLLNSKLQGRVLPRTDADVMKAKIQNELLDYQWDAATIGGPMIEKIAMTDQSARLFGAGFVLVYWDTEKNTNEIKPIDARDIFWDYGATHKGNAKWAQVREWTTPDQLEVRGYKVSKLRDLIASGSNDIKSTTYEDQVKVNRGITDATGMDVLNPVIEVVTEWTPTKCTIFAPRYSLLIEESENPYKHGEIPVSMLRYYPLGTDIYGESEVEHVIPLQRAINALLCGFIDEMNIAMRPPLKIITGQVKLESIEYGPGAKWIMNGPNAVTEMQLGGSTVSSFNSTYPALVAAYNTAVGDASLGVSNVSGQFNEKTATEVASLEKQQNNRDQYNQLYLSEFLKDIMGMWISNNKQYLFDDPTKQYQILKIIGKDKIKELQNLGMDATEVPEDAMMQIGGVIAENPNAVQDGHLQSLMQDIAVPKQPVITNPEVKNPADYNIVPKLHKTGNNEADLYMTPEDFEGTFDYVPDVKSMAAGAGVQMQQARQLAITNALNKEVQSQLAMQGEMLNLKELLSASFEDAGFKDSDSLFMQIPKDQNQPTGKSPTESLNYKDAPPDIRRQIESQAGLQPSQIEGGGFNGGSQPGGITLPGGANTNGGGPGGLNSSQAPIGVGAFNGVSNLSQAIPNPDFSGGMAGPQGIPNQ